MSRMARDLFLHVGTSKSGTSSLQAGLGSSVEAVAAAGLGMPFPRRGPRVWLLRTLGWEVVEGFPHPVDQAQLEKAAKRMRRCDGDRLLVSVEDLAELDAGRIQMLGAQLEASTKLVPHVVITCRDWSKQLPSEWQQQLKRRLTTDFPTWLAQVRDGEAEESRQFRLRQDVADIARRWSALVPPERIHVVPVGAPGQDRDTIFQQVAAITGIDDAAIERPNRSVNRSYGWLECELLRRLNLELGDRMTDIHSEYNPGVRRVLAKGVLDRAGDQRVTLPPEDLGWVQDEMRRQVDALRALGVREHGDLDLLVPGEESVGPLPEVDEADLGQAALQTLASFAVRSLQMRRAAQARSGATEHDDDADGDD